jgi:NAD+ synthase
LKFDKNALKIDAEKEVERIVAAMRRQATAKLKRRGAVVGVSGGIDSSVVVALCTRAFGPAKVLGVMMPETDSSPESERLARILADHFGFKIIMSAIGDGLKGLGCYQKRDSAVKSVFPEFTEGWKTKITIPNNILDKETFNFFQLEATDEKGRHHTNRLPVDAYLQIVAASNLKQRLRMSTLYYHAEARNWMVVGTGNKDEHLQGFFVKYGDGGSDTKPIAHLFKTQVFQLAEALGVPETIRKRTPTTDTYSAEQTQEEFFFGLDFYRMDMLWYAMEHGVPAAEAALVLGITEEQAARGYYNIERKITATEYLRMHPLEIDD